MTATREGTGTGGTAPAAAERKGADGPGSGRALHGLLRDLYPICRSITGDGVRATLDRLGERIPLEVREVPTGTEVLDWTVPEEWNIDDAWIRGPGGEKVVDFRDSNLHVVGYSEPVHATLTREELAERVHTLPDRPGLVPYRTSYYDRTWGFCMSHERFRALPEGEYEVRIDASLEPGSLTYGECLLEGETGREVLISTHVCHPSLANDNLSGVVVAAGLARALAERDRRHSYRFVFVPATIGAITWLARNRERLDRIDHGLVLAGVGDDGELHYKRSRRGDAEIDRVAEHVLPGDPGERVRDFVPYGYDERQYCSPGFDLPVGCLMRTPWGEYPEYHTSADDPGFVRPESLEASLETCLRIVEVLEANRRYVNLRPEGEPQLGRRGLYDDVGGRVHEGEDWTLALLWVLNQSDGSRDLVSVAERSGLSFDLLAAAAGALLEADLLEPAGGPASAGGSR